MKQSTLIALAFAAFTSATPLLETRADCAPVHIIAARASTEAAGPGIIGDVMDDVVSQSSQTITTASVDYPATLTDYAASSASGTAALKTMLTNQVAACPNQKIVLMGYSQGAHVIGDTLGGGGGPTVLLGAKTAPVATSVSDKVVAVVLMGDPRHVAGESFQEGTATLLKGLFPRGSDQSLESFSSKIHSFCDIGDLFCASGTSTLIHLAYVTKYGSEAVDFVLGKIGN
ncbi:uncharacterized protein H6S33_002838 [Morchella sextelata]|uniref:uncharacterized protein n=1 Tax=Morchella sextelata TaxID=1174677 RepID=UPI001D047B92|nr:uncharacterized protein H6S33_002838 [Morchella sextelata]KAH0607804.1 hypothetical protein H6S33_002838 [Morchella sextelata]